ncbi:dethiobiotin synthase [Nguyenibacter vanlangensis]|uniref:ATP-dependent dethiobiotin synthetase BioD n=1 Tax=Nguyenibacter vanlangensis TaxID=1216886 RepID=A0ABZ3D757_9PROT
MTARKHQLAARFGAATEYDGAARIQHLVAARLAERIAAGAPPPARILELGCGTGFLGAHLRRLFPDADLTVTDLAPEMVARARQRLGEDGKTRFLTLDAEDPAAAGSGYDLICSSLSMQWFADRATTLARLAALLAPGGMMGFSTLCAGSFAEWRAVHQAAGVPCATPAYPDTATLQADWPWPGQGRWQTETVIDRPASPLAFLRELRQIGASLPQDGARPLGAGTMRRLLAALDARGASQGAPVMTYRIGYGMFRAPPQKGVFVTGTDTGVGKTLVSACLVRAWGARYWKPLQTGIAEETADADTLAALGACAPAAIHPAFATLAAPLSPLDAAELAGTPLDVSGIALPPPADPRPLVVEGAGGVMVPVTADCMMIDLIARFALPVILVARSGLGTINHTLLTLQALRERGIAVAGIVLNGPPSAAARRAVTQFGHTRILAEFPHLDRIGPEQVETLARTLPDFATIWRTRD